MLAVTYLWDSVVQDDVYQSVLFYPVCTKSSAPWEGFAEASVSCSCLLSAIVSPTVSFSITADGKPLDHISFELFDDEDLKTVEDIHALGTGKKGFDQKSSSFHKNISGFMCQGGNFICLNGTGCKPIWGGDLRR